MGLFAVSRLQWQLYRKLNDKRIERNETKCGAQRQERTRRESTGKGATSATSATTTAGMQDRERLLRTAHATHDDWACKSATSATKQRGTLDLHEHRLGAKADLRAKGRPSLARRSGVASSVLRGSCDPQSDLGAKLASWLGGETATKQRLLKNPTAQSATPS